MLTLIVIGIAYKEKINTSIIKNNENINSQQSPTILSPEDNKHKEINIRKNEEQVIKEEKNKLLENKYEESYKAFSDKKYEEAINIANKILEEDNSFYKAYNIRGIALCYSKSYEEGMKDIDKALEIRPDFGYARFNKALAYELHGDYDDALNWYDKDLEIENYIWSYYGKASIYGRRGDVENTVKYLKTAVDMSPDIKIIAEQEEDFNPVKDSQEFQNIIK
ncbi:hypothetical protein HGI79_04710 [Clostridium sp. DJ247]|nr:tetratricopeptide repeat protein [Clostridium sp. DJ247]MBC2579615.1 hypothetical protein [Clostridium sp. DJ247]